MGSGASTSPASTPEPLPNKDSKPVAATKPMGIDASNKTCLVRTNEVAPIIIKNCREEFQHVTDFKEPIVYGSIADNMPEHALIQNRYFLVRDVTAKIDTLGTMARYLAPNVRQCKGSYPVYGMGQPTQDGLHYILDQLKEDGYSDVLVFNLRNEPVVFLRDSYDMVPYSLRDHDNIGEIPDEKTFTALDLRELEAKIRKETIDLATLRDGNLFFFYNDMEKLVDEPHMYRVAYEDDLLTTDEVYARPAFNCSGNRYLRFCLSRDGAPLEKNLDAFVHMFKNTPNFLNNEEPNLPALIFTCQEGQARATCGMVLGSLMLAHKCGFPQQSLKSPVPINDRNPNLDRGEYVSIRQLVRYFKKGLSIKHEVDVMIDLCTHTKNIRTIIHEHTKNLECIKEDYIIEGRSAKDHFKQKCISSLERYFYLICFNAYLHDQFPCQLAVDFTEWMQGHPLLYRILSLIDVSERYTSADLLSKGHRVLVADEHIRLDVLSSQMDVKTSNFRRVPGLPVYGMAQPSREGMAGVANYLLNKKQGHPRVVIFNLREDLVIECNGDTFSPREAQNLEEPITMPGITAAEIEEKEDQLKKEIKSKANFQIYRELTDPPESPEFTSVLTPLEMFGQLKMQIPAVEYHRIPMNDDAAPSEKHFDQILTIINGQEEIHSDEDGPALVFHCRTGKGRTTTAMAIAGLIYCHKRGFPYGTKPGEEERVSLPNASFTKGNYKVVQDIVRLIPDGQQVKREVDFILDQCSDTMTPMHYHVREVIFVIYNKIKKAKNEEDRKMVKKNTLDYLERYLYLILFNAYLHCERHNLWQRPFSQWMTQVASKAGVYDVLDELTLSEFSDFESTPGKMRTRRDRWNMKQSNIPFRGKFL